MENIKVGTKVILTDKWKGFTTFAIIRLQYGSNSYYPKPGDKAIVYKLYDNDFLRHNGYENHKYGIEVNNSGYRSRVSKEYFRVVNLQLVFSFMQEVEDKQW